MKKILLGLFLVGSLTALTAGANTFEPQTGPSPRPSDKPPVSKKIIGAALGIFDALEVSSIVDEMDRDGVTERSFGAAFGVEGRVLKRVLSDYSNALSYRVKLTTDGKVRVDVSAIEYKGPIGDFNNKADVKFLSFIMDRGLSFRDVTTTTVEIVRADFDIGLARDAKGADALVLNLGASFAGEIEEYVTLADGRRIQVGVEYKPGTREIDGIDTGMGSNWRGGLSYHRQIGKGQLKASAILSYSAVGSGQSTINMTTGERYVTSNRRETAFFTPGATYTLPASKSGTSVTIDAHANLTLANKVTGLDPVDLVGRERQPYTVGVKMNFGAKKKRSYQPNR